jgi:hypothetical protein
MPKIKGQFLANLSPIFSDKNSPKREFCFSYLLVEKQRSPASYLMSGLYLMFVVAPSGLEPELF